MLNPEFISLEIIVDRVFKSGLNPEHIDYWDIIENVGEAIRLIGVPYMLQYKVTNGEGSMPDEITIADYRGTLPTDIVHIDSVRDFTTKEPYVYTTSSFKQTYTESNLTTGRGQVMLSYYVQGDYIFTNIEEGYVEIAYTAYQTDDNGYPMIPNEERVIKAVHAYVMYIITQKLWMSDKITKDKFSYWETEWMFYVNSARTKAHMPNLDREESFKNQMQRMIRPAHAHASHFNYLNKPEIPNY